MRDDLRGDDSDAKYLRRRLSTASAKLLPLSSPICPALHSGARFLLAAT